LRPEPTERKSITTYQFGYNQAHRFRASIDLQSQPIPNLAGLLHQKCGWPEDAEIILESSKPTSLDAFVFSGACIPNARRCVGPTRAKHDFPLDRADTFPNRSLALAQSRAPLHYWSEFRDSVTGQSADFMAKHRSLFHNAGSGCFTTSAHRFPFVTSRQRWWMKGLNLCSKRSGQTCSSASPFLHLLVVNSPSSPLRSSTAVRCPGGFRTCLVQEPGAGRGAASREP